MKCTALISALPFVIREREKEEIRKIYTADALKIIAGNTSRYNGGETMSVRYYDLIKPHKTDNRTAKQIADDVIKKSGLVKREGGERDRFNGFIRKDIG